MQLITNASEVEDGLSRLKSNEYFSLDTEFLRTETYYPKLCLLQFAAPGYEFAIDITILEDDKEWPAVKQQLHNFLSNPDYISVLHACQQDIEIIEHYFSATIVNIFDTQVASRFLGMPLFPSYSSLIDKYLNIQLDKKFQFCDWSKRPLSIEQLNYAKLDVLYLGEIYPKILSELKQQKKYDWFHEDMQSLAISPIHDKENAILKLLYKVFPQLNSLAEAKICYALVYAREKTAMMLDISRPKIIHNDHIILASQQQKLRLAKSKVYKMHQPYFNIELDIILSEQEIWNPLVEKVWANIAAIYYQKTAKFFEAKALLTKLANSHNITPDLIASTNDILKALVGEKSKINQGWRYELFAKYI